MVPRASAAVSEWQKGVSVYPVGARDFGTEAMHKTLEEIKADNAGFVSFVIPYYQKTVHSAEMFPGSDTPSDDNLSQAIVWAHDFGLAVALKLHLDTTDGAWRANIDPTNRNAWFDNYENLLTHYAVMAKVYNVEQLVIGTELISMAAANIHFDNTAHWEKMIDDIRKYYFGELTYSANWGPDTSNFANEKVHIDFWPKLDYIGLSAYFRLTTKDSSVESLKNSWKVWDDSDIRPLADKYGKKILFTEMGYRSSRNAHAAPYDFKGNGVYDATEQVNSYEAMFSYWNDKPYIAGVSIWDFYADPKAGGEGNTDYTPQNKPAEETLKKWFWVPQAAKPDPVPASSSKSFFEQNLDALNSFLRSKFSLPLLLTVDLTRVL
jgi:hypothetical protein